MTKTIDIRIREELLQLHPFRAIFWEKEKALLLSDLHLGKLAHFRKKGIPVPLSAGENNWDQLTSLLLTYCPERVIFLGDLFHSHLNAEWEAFSHLLQQFSAIHFELIPGNHDILRKEVYEATGLSLHKPSLAIAPFVLTHEPMASLSGLFYNLAGHLHPSVKLAGNGRQSLRLPCFYFTENQGILPAFGVFTGLATIQPKMGDHVFVVADDAVFPVTG